jgi:hypothetical protein
LRGLLLCLLLTALPASAFKIETHVFLGQELINDLRSCTAQRGHPCVNLRKQDGSLQPLRVKPAVAAAILNHEKTFLTGTFGPDAFADVAAGQTVIHPGLVNSQTHQASGWGAGNWVGHLIAKAQTPEEVAFAYGFAGHAAADTFAHSYVNAYAGDVFNLLDETDVEERHLMIETYVAKHTPALAGADGQGLGRTLDYLGGQHQLFAPIDFVRRAMVADKEAKSQNARGAGGQQLVAFDDLSVALQQALHKTHLDFDVKASAQKIMFGTEHRSLATVLSETRRDLRDAGLVQQLEVVIIQIVAYYYAELLLDAGEASKAAEVLHHINRLIEGSTGKIYDVRDQIHAEAKKLTRVRNQVINESIGAAVSVSGSILMSAFTVEQQRRLVDAKATELARAEQDLQDAINQKLCDAQRDLCELVKPTTVGDLNVLCVQVDAAGTVAAQCKEDRVEKHCNDVWKFLRLQQVCKTVLKPVVVSCPAISGSVDAAKKVCDHPLPSLGGTKVTDRACVLSNEACRAGNSALLKVRGELQTLVNELTAQKASLVDELQRETARLDAAKAKLRKATDDVLATEARVRATLHDFERNSITAAVQLSSLMRPQVERWQRETVLATNDWIKANAQAMLYSTAPEKDDRSAFEPIKLWLICRGPVLTGAPIAGSEAVCGPLREILDIHREVTRIENEALKFLADRKIPGASHLAAQFLHFRENGPFIVSGVVQRDLVAKFGGERAIDVHLLHHAVKSRHDDDAMLKKFATDESRGKQLLLFPTAAGSGTVLERINADLGINGGDERFAVERFAPAHNALQLMKLALAGGAELNELTRAMGVDPPLYRNEVTSLLTDWLRSIDGNHQWLTLAPPYLRRAAGADVAWTESLCQRRDLRRRYGRGTPLFSDPGARERVFKQLFSPLSPQLEMGGRWVDLRPAGHPYLPAANEPYPEFSERILTLGCPIEPPRPTAPNGEERGSLGFSFDPAVYGLPPLPGSGLIDPATLFPELRGPRPPTIAPVVLPDLDLDLGPQIELRPGRGPEVRVAPRAR